TSAQLQAEGRLRATASPMMLGSRHPEVRVPHRCLMRASRSIAVVQAWSLTAFEFSGKEKGFNALPEPSRVSWPAVCRWPLLAAPQRALLDSLSIPACG